MRRLALTTLLAAVLLAGLPAATASAGCGTVQRVAPIKKRFGPGRAPLIVGDSVLLGAMRRVAFEGFEVNAHGCRGWKDGVRYLWARRHAHRLPKVVVMQLGTNWSISVGLVQRALDIMGRRRLLVVMTPREVGGFGGADALAVRRAGRRFGSRMLVLDWARHTRRKPGWFQPDGIHLTYAGVRGLGRYLRHHRRFLRPPAAVRQPAGQRRAASA